MKTMIKHFQSIGNPRSHFVCRYLSAGTRICGRERCSVFTARIVCLLCLTRRAPWNNSAFQFHFGIVSFVHGFVNTFLGRSPSPDGLLDAQILDMDGMFSSTLSTPKCRWCECGPTQDRVSMLPMDDGVIASFVNERERNEITIRYTRAPVSMCVCSSDVSVL